MNYGPKLPAACKIKAGTAVYRNADGLYAPWDPALVPGENIEGIIERDVEDGEAVAPITGGKTQEQSLPAGPDLDRIIAEKVMGLGVLSQMTNPPTPVGYISRAQPGNPDLDRPADWSPSTNIAQAMETVRDQRLALWRTGDGQWHASFGEGYADDEAIDFGTHDGPYGHGPTPELAICRAALAIASSKP